MHESESFLIVDIEVVNSFLIRPSTVDFSHSSRRMLDTES